MVISPYSILYLIVIFAVGFASGTAGDMGQTLEFAGKSPVAYGTAVLVVTCLVFWALRHI